MSTNTLTTPPNKGSNVIPVKKHYKSIVRKPPVEIDDELWFVIDGQIYKATVCLISWTQYRGLVVTEIRGEVSSFHTVSVKWEDWNKKLFRTKEAAEASLCGKARYL